ncbi:hypothetical protein LCGC14_0644650 [marine sediment metagenome]|uniref:YkgJ family cysteine cluster protein n=1 Tax=marine sediment metagenome TaxID=412755 RepID=A0A0F9U6K4_9ZZZZ|nr:YkgJ family cysteine cluster protein [Phycisphaerae bacterium]HDZ45255.1 YkgJ family cysteine cluster protein [Phycisphaerae bacterium]
MGVLSRRPPWYAAGLAFECSGCGGCCAGPDEGYIWVTGEQIAAMAEHIALDEKEFRRQYVRKVGRRLSLKEHPTTKDCIFLQPTNGGRSCSVYPVRPPQCRTWPFWPNNLATPQTWAWAGVRCPGVNRGPVHSRDEIDRERDETP